MSEIAIWQPRIMEMITYDSRTIFAETPIDETIGIEINGSIQRVRVCAHHTALPLVIVVQAGPGFPLLHEVRKFQRKLGLERKVAVCYWDQRGCGNSDKKNVEAVSFEQQVNDLRALIRWAAEQSRQKVTLLGISLGATYSLLAAEKEIEHINAVVAISIDINISESDSSTAEFLAAKADTMSRSFGAKLKKLSEPPYEDVKNFQKRAELLMDAGVIERGKSFKTGALEMIAGLLKTYGPLGAAKAIGNMNVVQRKLLPEIAKINVLTDLPPLPVPVYCVVGELDPLMPEAARKRLAEVEGYSITTIPEAGHMAHFDRPDIVSSIVFGAACGGDDQAKLANLSAMSNAA